MFIKILHIIEREYFSRVKSKTFVFSTLITPLFMFLVLVVPGLLSRSDKETQRILAVKDNSGILIQNIQNSLKDTLSSGKPAFIFIPVDERQISLDSDSSGLLEQFRNAGIDGLLEIDKNVLLNGKVILYSQIVSDLFLNRRISSALNSAIVNLRLTNEGFQPEIIHRLMRGANVEIVKVGKEGVHKEKGQSVFLAFLLMMILYMTLVLYGTTLMRSVIEEKMSRIVEVLLSSVRPFQLMIGKILGVSLVGLTQYLIWVTCGVVLFAYGDSLARFFPSLPPIPQLPSVPALLFFYFILFFMLGYLFYATLFAAVGALAGEEGDTQQLVFPILLPLMFPILAMVYIQANPDSPKVVLMSLIPFFTPMVMMVRVIISTPPLWQILASILIMLISILFTTYLAGRIYRIAILMYGKRPAFSEVIRWIRKG